MSPFFPSCPIYRLFILLKFLSSNFVSLYSFPILMASSITSRQTTPKAKTSLPRVFPQASSVLPTHCWNFAFPDAARLMKATHFLRLEPWDVRFFPCLRLISRILPRPLTSVFLALRRPPPPLPSFDMYHLLPGLLQWLLVWSHCPCSLPGQFMLP